MPGRRLTRTRSEGRQQSLGRALDGGNRPAPPLAPPHKLARAAPPRRVRGDVDMIPQQEEESLITDPVPGAVHAVSIALGGWLPDIVHHDLEARELLRCTPRPVPPLHTREQSGVNAAEV